MVDRKTTGVKEQALDNSFVTAIRRTIPPPNRMYNMRAIEEAAGVNLRIKEHKKASKKMTAAAIAYSCAFGAFCKNEAITIEKDPKKARG